VNLGAVHGDGRDAATAHFGRYMLVVHCASSLLYSITS
jgi:hypothetical protein